MQTGDGHGLEVDARKERYVFISSGFGRLNHMQYPQRTNATHYSLRKLIRTKLISVLFTDILQMNKFFLSSKCWTMKNLLSISFTSKKVQLQRCSYSRAGEPLQILSDQILLITLIIITKAFTSTFNHISQIITPHPPKKSILLLCLSTYQAQQALYSVNLCLEPRYPKNIKK